jgi:GT2 family glycosyltransferase
LTSSVSPFVSVIVTALDVRTHIKESLISLLRMDYPRERHEILVVDNGSKDGTTEIVKQLPVRYLWEGRRGVSHARNRGIVESKGDILAFTDPDCLASRRWLPELVRAFEGEGVGGVAGEIVPFPGKTPAEQYAARRRSHSQMRPMKHALHPFAMTPNVAYRREVFQQIGLFDTRFPGGGWEDADLCWRFFRGTHFTLGYAPNAVVFHRYRTTVREFFIQHVRYGDGLARIYAKYHGDLSPGWQQSIHAYWNLANLTWILARDVLSGAETSDLYAAWFDFLRQAGQRIGFLGGTILGGRLAPLRLPGESTVVNLVASDAARRITVRSRPD